MHTCVIYGKSYTDQLEAIYICIYTKGPANVLKLPVHEAGQIQSKSMASL